MIVGRLLDVVLVALSFSSDPVGGRKREHSHDGVGVGGDRDALVAVDERASRREHVL